MATNRKSQNATESKGRARKKPGSGGSGDYYHVEVRERGNLKTFRTQDVGDPGHLQRVAGKRESGSWTTVKWLISKEDAHVEQGKLVPDTSDALELIGKLGSQPVQVKGDRFKARPQRNTSGRSEPTAAQTRTRREKIKNGQAARQQK